MRRQFLIGLDAGGGGGRCLLVNVESKDITVSWRSWSHPPAQQGDSWSFDLDLPFIWESLAAAVHEAMQKADAHPDEVAGIAATSMRHTLVVLDKSDRVVYAGPNNDARAADQAMELGAQRGKEFYQRTGHWANPIFQAARLLWLASSLPGILDSVKVAFTLGDWLAYQMCGKIVSEPSQAAESMLFDVNNTSWAVDLIASLSLPPRIFPPLQPAGSLLGKLTPEAASFLGLQSGIPVAVGCGDTQSALLGSGVTDVNQMGIVAGTTAPLMLVTSQPLFDAQQRLWTSVHALPGKWVLESNAGAMGQALNWISSLLFPGFRFPGERLDAEASFSSPGAAGLLSTFGAQVFNAANMSLPAGDLVLSHLVGDENDSTHRAHLCRAVLEGMACAVRANIEQIVQVDPSAHPRFILSGGMSRSREWPQILADMLGQPVEIAHTPESTSLGAAACAGAGAGLFETLGEASLALASQARRMEPNPQRVELYQDLYEDWNALRAARQSSVSIVTGRLMRKISERPVKRPTPRSRQFQPRIYVSAPMDDGSLDRLRRLGDVKYASYREAMNVLVGNDLVEALQGVQVLVTEVDVVDAEALSKLPDLRLVVSCRGNAVNVDLAACSAFSVPVLNTPGRNADAVADLAIAFILMLSRKLPGAVQFLREPGSEAGDLARMGLAYSQFQGHELWRKTVGLVGMGAIGRLVAQRLRSFGMRVLAYDPYLAPEQAVREGVELVSLENLLRKSDVVSLHAPVTDATRGMLGAPQIAMMKPGAFLVNTARAALVDEAALLEALNSGHLGGAALDVFSTEPPGADNPLLSAPNLIATPHIGGNSFQVAAHQGQMVVEELERLLAGERPRYLLNPQVFEGFSWTGARRKVSDEQIVEFVRSGGPAISDLKAPSAPASVQPPLKIITELPVERTAEPEVSPTEPTSPSSKSLFSGLRNLFSSKSSSSQSVQSVSKSVAASGPKSAAISPVSTSGDTVNKLENILRQFLASSEKDSILQSFSENRRLTMHYQLTDAGLDFHMIFDNGTFIAALGAPPARADLTLKMKAEVFDGMMTGAINGATAAMTGKLKFSGDTAKAMVLQKIQKDIMRLYQKERDAVGGPGDLSKLAAGGAAAAAPPLATVPAATAAVQPSAAPSRSGFVPLGDERDDLVRTVLELFEINLITATGGNLSVRLSGQPDQLWITPSAMYKGDLRPSMMVRINLRGETLDEDALSPSSERRVHTEIFRRRPDLNAVIHTHAPWATLLALSGTPFLPVSTEAAFIGDLPVVPFIMPGTDELAIKVAEALGEKGVAVLMQNHGLVVAGSSLRRAASTSEVIERYSELILRCLALGKTPPVLPEEAVKTLREMGQMMA